MKSEKSFRKSGTKRLHVVRKGLNSSQLALALIGRVSTLYLKLMLTSEAEAPEEAPADSPCSPPCTCIISDSTSVSNLGF